MQKGIASGSESLGAAGSAVMARYIPGFIGKKDAICSKDAAKITKTDYGQHTQNIGHHAQSTSAYDKRRRVLM